MNSLPSTTSWNSRKRSRPTTPKTPKSRIEEAALTGVTSFKGVFGKPKPSQPTEAKLTRASSFSTYNPVISSSNDACSMLLSPPTKKFERSASAIVSGFGSRENSIADENQKMNWDHTEFKEIKNPFAKESRVIPVPSLTLKKGKITIPTGPTKSLPPPQIVDLGETFMELPFDWTLSTGLIITSPTKLTDLIDSSPYSTETDLVKDACDGIFESLKSHLSTWTFSKTCSPSQTTVLKRSFAKKKGWTEEEELELKYWNQYETDFVTALISAFNSLRFKYFGQQGYFFYCNAEFSVLFRRIVDGDDVEAFVTKISPGLREVLRRQGINGDLLHSGTSISLLSEEKYPKLTMSLQISNRVSVKKFIEYLASWQDPQPTRRSEYGTPRIYAPWPFLNGTLSFCQVLDKGQVTRVADGTQDKPWRVQINGVILPTKLNSLIRRIQVDGLSIDVTEVENTTKGVNICPTSFVWPNQTTSESRIKSLNFKELEWKVKFAK